MKRLLLLTAAVLGLTAALGAQSVQADPGSNGSIVGTVTDAANRALDSLPSPGGWQPRHACVIVDDLNWGECVTFPFPS